jgi:hypothetical protein
VRLSSRINYGNITTTVTVLKKDFKSCCILNNSVHGANISVITLMLDIPAKPQANRHQKQAGDKPEVKYGVRSPKFIWAPCHVMFSSVLIG